MKTGIFISYNHKDRKIADTLVDGLSAISSDLDVFIDHSGLESGEEYETKITQSILHSHWFLFVYSGSARSDKNMDWCFYEAGQFRANFMRKNPSVDINKRICCLYDYHLPGPLGKYQATHISTKDQLERDLPLNNEDNDIMAYEQTELFRLFTDIERSTENGLRRVKDDNVRRLMRRGVRKVTLAFSNNRVDDFLNEVVFQPRYFFELAAVSSGEVFSDGTIIYAEDNKDLSTVFGITGNSSNWGEIKKSALLDHNAEPLWIADLEAAIINIAKNRAPIQTQTVCLANDQKYYLPLVARFEAYRSGKKKCYLVFVPLPDRRFANLRSSILLVGLIKSIRFRQRILPQVVQLSKLRRDDEARRWEVLSAIERDVLSIESEGVEFGLPITDRLVPLLNGFRDGKAKEALRKEFARWTVTRDEFFAKLSAARASKKQKDLLEVCSYIVNKLTEFHASNTRFIYEICGELQYAIHAEERDGT